jgi:homoserine dehydrogenase
VETAYYLRLQAQDRPGVLADVTRILADCGISIEALMQKEAPPSAQRGADHPADQPGSGSADERGDSGASRRWTASAHRSMRIRLEYLESD